MRYWCIPALLLLVVLGCHRDKFNTDRLAESEWDPSVAGPLVNTTLGVDDILARTDSSDVSVDPQTGQIALVYDGNIFSFKGDSLVQLPDQSLPSGSLSLSNQEENDLIDSGSVTKKGSADHVFNVQNGIEIDSTKLKNGTLDLELNSTFQHDGKLTITLPRVTKNGQQFQTTCDIDYQGSTPVTVEKELDLSDHTFDLTKGGDTVNRMVVEWTMKLEYNSGNPTNGEITYDLGLTDLEFSWVFGDIGTQDIDLSRDSVFLRVFRSTTDGFFKLTESRIDLDIVNSFGFPMEVKIDTLRAVNLNTGQSTPVILNGFPNPFDVNYPNQLGDSANTDLTIDKTNSNINDLVTSTPKYFDNVMTARSNPPGSNALTNFVSDESKVSIRPKVTIPLTGFAHGWKLMDTTDLDIDDERPDEVDEVLVRSIIDNGFPINGQFQLYLADSTGTVIDSLYDGNTQQIISGPVNQQGRVVESRKKIADTKLKTETIDRFFKADQLILKATAETYQAQQEKVVRIYDDYEIQVNIGVKVDGKVIL